MRTKSGAAMYAGVTEAMSSAAGDKEFYSLKAFLEDMHALKYLEDKVRDFIENADRDEENVGEL